MLLRRSLDHASGNGSRFSTNHDRTPEERVRFQIVEAARAVSTTKVRRRRELVKDLAAIANSGGGMIVFGLDSQGAPTGESIEGITSIDPADIANKVGRYTGLGDFEFEVRQLVKQTNKLAARSRSEHSGRTRTGRHHYLYGLQEGL
jgi:hypothetical protein